MGEAKLRLEQANRVVVFDFDAPKYIKMSFALGEVSNHREITLATINALVRAKFGQQMPRSDGKTFAAWQEVMIDQQSATPEMILAQVEWLAQIAEDNAVKIDPFLSHAREALADYLRQLKLEAADTPTPPKPTSSINEGRGVQP